MKIAKYTATVWLFVCFAIFSCGHTARKIQIVAHEFVANNILSSVFNEEKL